MGLKILFAAYRDWALNVLPSVQAHPRVELVHHVSSIDELEMAVTGRAGSIALPTSLHDHINFDLVMLCGWSWQVSRELLARVLVVSEHPAYLDEYSLGTPLQGQIVDGIERTKHRVVKIGYPELGERLYSPEHEVDMNLTGNMNVILSEMESTARTIYMRFLDDYPNVQWKQWPAASSMRRPRKPEDSRLTKEDIETLTTKQLYDRMRMLESPYPNAFIEDEHGTLYIEKVRFKSKK